MRNNAPAEHCVAEALISDAGLYPMSEKSFTLRIHLMIEITRILRQRLNTMDDVITKLTSIENHLYLTEYALSP